MFPEESAFLDLMAAMPEDDKEIVERAYVYACSNHRGQKRKSGQPYIVHPIGTAHKLYSVYKDPILAAAALLHDTVEDCEKVCRKDIYRLFGKEIGFIVESVTKHLTDFYNIPDIEITDRVERLLWAGMKDVRVLLLKLADRENNLETLGQLKENKQIRMAFETQAIFMPLKRVLGYNEGVTTVENASVALTSFLKKEKMKSAGELKEFLFQESFETLDSEMFGLVYGDTSSIVWKISDIETYKRICETEALEGKIKFESVSGNLNWFKASFRFHMGALMPNNVNLTISSFQS